MKRQILGIAALAAIPLAGVITAPATAAAQPNGTGAASDRPAQAANPAGATPNFCGTGSGGDVRLNVEGGWTYRSSPWPEGDPTGCYGTGNALGTTSAGSVLWYCWTYGNTESINGYTTNVWYRADGYNGNGYIAGHWVWAGGVDTPGGVDPVAGLRRCLP